MKTKLLSGLCAAFLTLLLNLTLSAQVPSLINYQGRLTDAQGNPVTGNRTMVVKVYNAPSGGNLTYQESIGSVFVRNGTYSFAFGATGNGVATILTGEDYLSLSVNGTEESSRTRLLAVPFAIRSMESIDTKNLRNDLVNLGVLPSPSGSPSRVIGLSGNLVFGNVAIGQTVNRTLGISNTGNGNLTISSLGSFLD